MKTTKPISTISYNTPEFLENKLNELLANGLISFFAYILHEPEEDETKRHLVYPNLKDLTYGTDLR